MKIQVLSIEGERGRAARGALLRGDIVPLMSRSASRLPIGSGLVFADGRTHLRSISLRTRKHLMMKKVLEVSEPWPENHCATRYADARPRSAVEEWTRKSL